MIAALLLVLLMPVAAQAQAMFNACSSTGIAIVAHGDSTSAPPFVSFSTGYYAGLFYNVTDGGSDATNANHVGLVAQSAYSNAFYAQQGGAPGSPADVLQRNNVYPSAYVTRVIGNLNGHDFTAPVLKVEDMTQATGDLAWIGANGAARLRLSKTTPLSVTGVSSVAAVLSGATSPVSNAVQLRFKGRADGEVWSLGPDISTSTGSRDLEVYNLLTDRPAFTITANDMVKLAPTSFANLGTPGDGTVAYCGDCHVASSCAAGGTGAFARRIAGQWNCQ